MSEGPRRWAGSLFWLQVQIFSGDAGGIGGHLLRCAAGHDAPAALAAAGAKVHKIVGVADHIQIVLNDHHSGPAVNGVV